MASCVVCGGEDERLFSVLMADGRELVFDTLQCAIDAVAERCDRCGVRVIGRPSRARGVTFCSPRCSESPGVHELLGLHDAAEVQDSVGFTADVVLAASRGGLRPLG